MKKILVSGCANCPYCIIYNNGNENKDDYSRIVKLSCKHPSMSKELPTPYADVDKLMLLNNENFLETIFDTPSWCPLPNE